MMLLEIECLFLFVAETLKENHSVECLLKFTVEAPRNFVCFENNINLNFRSPAYLASLRNFAYFFYLNVFYFSQFLSR